MKKNITVLLALAVTSFTYAQVGINNESPKATLDVSASPTDLTKTDGFIAPRLKGSELKAKDVLYDVPQTGAIVYVSEALLAANTTTKTANVTTIGYYYFNGAIWVKMNDANTVTASNGLTKSADDIKLGGTLSDATTIITSSTNTLALKGLPAGSGNFLIVDTDGIIKTSTSVTNLPFVLPAVKSTSYALGMGAADITGATAYIEDSTPGSIWKPIPGLESTFNIISAVNSISISSQGNVQYEGDMSQAAAVSYSIGIFVDGKLKAVRLFSLDGSAFGLELSTWTVLGQVNNLSTGSHTIKVYTTRRNNSPSSTSNPNHPGLGIIIGGSTATLTNTNDFINKAVLQISGVYAN